MQVSRRRGRITCELYRAVLSQIALGAMSDEDKLEKIRVLLNGLSTIEVRELAVAGLRKWYAKADEKHAFSIHGELGLQLVLLLGELKRMNPDARDLMGAFLRLGDKRIQAVLEFVHWFVAAGFGFPMLHHDTENYPFPITFHLTERGHQFLSAEEDHPILPSATARVEARCPGLLPEVISLLADSRECLERMLLRPAVVMMGAAYELAIERVVDALTKKNVLQDTDEWGAARRIAELKACLPNYFVPKTKTKEERLKKKEELNAARDAYDFADRLRARRNDASHTKPTYGFEDRAEIEELLVSAMRHLPAIWSLIVEAV